MSTALTSARVVSAAAVSAAARSSSSSKKSDEANEALVAARSWPDGEMPTSYSDGGSQTSLGATQTTMSSSSCGGKTGTTAASGPLGTRTASEWVSSSRMAASPDGP
ncbi:uncharacterized protein AMSG_12151 [Thecamonas trahens ATCC 50062]|uniref:Uncharacterized protein n=1 Tax=Thecamonas trahens ATCC 50062 TaxID=461836 RepID=A0A0L0DI09_THETB|nr:hypothetical protein AMSG_12151 [Thecamonas trahens ATCC 50062]KNC52004.1 hypothetical protein AMSG_12151 [Thecamonas trahens ATCC 50062]|eukprot:XP_013755636.1 hypothetical protein AMSG_12151 [Thecamonas trahens ATCC 50062]